eukprot:gb/GECH01008837.1/.p1 GENE.gb/GECH01008837.1/~~gb/GECH01008837.1/.p1  ORF type:complete len:113 (+),score=24.53 gb/GECH01008837.1/:1-339(+)
MELRANILKALSLVFGSSFLIYLLRKVFSGLKWIPFFNPKAQQNRENDTFLDSTESTGNFFDTPFLEDDEDLRLRPVSVNTYVYVLPTHHNEDGVFAKVLVENTSELSTEQE